MLLFFKIVVPEGSGANGSVGVAFLTVQRGISFVGETIVFWEVNDEGRQDLEPNSGNLTFMEVLYNIRSVLAHHSNQILVN